MKTYLLTLLSFMCFSSFAQISSIPIDVRITSDLITFTLPPPYHNPEYKPIAQPRYVATLRTLIMKEHNPSKKELLALLEEKLNNEQISNSRDEKLDYLKTVCLYIYFGNNNTLQVPTITRNKIAEWSSENESELKAEARIVADYFNFADKITDEFFNKKRKGVYQTD